MTGWKKIVANGDPVHVTDAAIETYTGRQFHLLAPRIEELCFDDIAHALSNICRFNGHSQRPYYVAEHSCLIADRVHEEIRRSSSPHYVKDMFGSTRWRIELAALMHDAAEAYIGDMTRPLKVKMLAFKDVEARIDAAVGQWLGTPYPLPPIVKEFDSRILHDERKQVMSQSTNMWGTDSLEPLGVEVQFWTQKRCKREFADRFFYIKSMIDRAP